MPWQKSNFSGRDSQSRASAWLDFGWLGVPQGNFLQVALGIEVDLRPTGVIEDDRLTLRCILKKNSYF
jgi:hypothetical protein